LQVVFIFGPTASGKLTIAREVAHMTGFRLFPDHLAVDLIKGVFDPDMRPYIRIREWAWTEVLREAVHINRSLVFTFEPQASIRSSFISHACVIIERRPLFDDNINVGNGDQDFYVLVRTGCGDDKLVEVTRIVIINRAPKQVP